MAEVELKGITKVYDNSVKAVDEVNFTIHDKEFVVVVGPSGCGKSTLLRMIAGLEEISEGELLIDGSLVNNVPPKDRDIAMVFQNYALYPHMTVFENIGFGLKLRKYSKPEIEKRVKEAAQTLDLMEYLNRRPKQLSGGQRQRVAVGRALVRNPKVFLFDEPLSNLDAKLRVQMRTEISKLHKLLGATMVYVTHDQTEAMTMGDRIVVLKDGKVQQIDTPINMYNKPANKFVAEFIGAPSMNFLKGEIKKVNKSVIVINKGTVELNLSQALEDRLESYDSENIIVGIRPEDIYISDPDSGIVVQVEVVEPMGNETFIYFMLDGKKMIARIASSIIIKPTDEINVKINTEKIHLFDTDSGLIIS